MKANEKNITKEKKLYAIKEEGGCIWKTELNVNEIEEICHEGAGQEMDDDRISIYLKDNYNTLYVDKIIAE